MKSLFQFLFWILSLSWKSLLYWINYLSAGSEWSLTMFLIVCCNLINCSGCFAWSFLLLKVELSRFVKVRFTFSESVLCLLENEFFVAVFSAVNNFKALFFSLSFVIFFMFPAFYFTCLWWLNSLFAERIRWTIRSWSFFYVLIVGFGVKPSIFSGARECTRVVPSIHCLLESHLLLWQVFDFVLDSCIS